MTRGLRLTLESGEALRGGGERRRQYLHRHVALQLRVGGLIHLPMPPSADLGGDLIRAESGAGSEGQRLDYKGERDCERDRSSVTVPIQPVDATVSASVTAGVR